VKVQVSIGSEFCRRGCDANAGLAAVSRAATTRAGLTLLTLVLAASLWGCTLPRWPVEGVFASPYGLRWNGGPDLHRGVDVTVPTGTPVYPMSPGTVRFAGVMSGFGNVVWIDHGNDVLTVYAHLSRVDVEQGQSVSREAPIALSGQSGNASGPHLHFEVWRRGREVDPVHALGGFPRTSGP
jgi:murein DD-endopeptidase MepM/ murein hydrolase activator NlpD